MIDNKIVEILEKYHNEVAEEISNINLAIRKIRGELKLVSDCLIGELLSYSKNTGIENKEKELELLRDSQTIREYIKSFDILDFRDNYYDEDTENQELEKANSILNLHDIIVLNNTLNCDIKHKIHDLSVGLPVLDESGDVNIIYVLASYCEDCNRYTITKEVFNTINGVILCEVINKIGITAENKEDVEIELSQRESILYRYGYNVKTSENLSTKQRHIIIASLVESGIMTRTQIIDHLTSLINRGEKIESWKRAVDKWKQDRYYTQDYKTENLPSVIANKILLGYKESMQVHLYDTTL